ncbi:hypothetical protein [Microseira sp. BLCC-F43]|jgi:hypothetical protein|uniref:hypothetical protein n=1 Tax=Microseira sp. BLCC-F43 TaxID=3153602 RepID=UPI0035B87BBB
MSKPIILIQPQLGSAPPKDQTNNLPPDAIWMGSSGVLALLTLGLGVYSFLQVKKLAKELRMEKFKSEDVKKKLKLALETIRKMETNPDLVHSREFNLDYLRMRMAEEVFHFAIVNQIKVKVKDKISIALRPTQAQQAAVGIATTAGRQVDETFDVEYQTADSPKSKKAVLFRIQIRLMKLPTQATSVTINQIIDCIETYLSPSDEHDNWQPTIQGRIVQIQWDQKAKPTPLLVLEQSNEGVNVSFATKRQVSAPAADMLPPTPPPSKRQAPGEDQKPAAAKRPTPGGDRKPPAPKTAPQSHPKMPLPANGRTPQAKPNQTRPPVNPAKKTAK